MVMTGQPQAGQAVLPPSVSTAKDPCFGAGRGSCEQGPGVMLVGGSPSLWRDFSQIPLGLAGTTVNGESGI